MADQTYVILIPYVNFEAGGKISVHELQGGQTFSAPTPEFENRSVLLVPQNNDRFLTDTAFNRDQITISCGEMVLNLYRGVGYCQNDQKQSSLSK